MAVVKIAQLSDLHCNGTKAWLNNFENVISCLKEVRPNIIVITGDCVNSPKKKFFDSLSSALNNLYDSLLKEGIEFSLVTIPGNHDIYPYGLYFLKWSWPFKNREKLFHSKRNEFLYPRVELKNILSSIYYKFNIAIFPLDTTQRRTFKTKLGPNRKMAFAQGAINDPHKVLSEWENFYQTLDESDSKRYALSKKIALLHHHPLPLPTPHSQLWQEPFLVMNNAYSLLHETSLRNIDLILHGHVHSSGIAEYKILSDNPNHCFSNIFVSGCASTASIENEKLERQIKIVNIHESGACDVEIYETSNLTATSSAFQNKARIPLNDYSVLRKKSYLNSASHIESISSKTKVINILDDGNGGADVTIRYEKIKFKKGCMKKEEQFIEERIYSDLGRVSRGLYVFNSTRVRRTSDQEIKWSHPSTSLLRPEAEESYSVQFKPSNLIADNEEGYLTILYRDSNAYALSILDHEEMYPIEADKFRGECCRIQTDYPTFNLELVIKFPKKEYFPINHEQIVVEVFRRKELEGSDGDFLKVLRGDYEQHKEETNFLRAKDAIKINPEFNQITLTVRYPQPDLVYALRWPVPKLHHDFCNNALLSMIDRYRKDLLEKSDKVKRFYNEVVLAIKEELRDQNLDFVLLGYDVNSKLLEVVIAPEKYSGTFNKLCVGRGPAGKAFKTREAQYIEIPLDPTLHDSEEDLLINLENVIPGLKPEAVLSIPIFPELSPDELDSSKSPDEAKSTQLVIGVLSIIANKTDSKLFKFRSGGRIKKTEAVKPLYKIIGAKFNEHIMGKQLTN